MVEAPVSGLEKGNKENNVLRTKVGQTLPDLELLDIMILYYIKARALTNCWSFPTCFTTD